MFSHLIYHNSILCFLKKYLFIYLAVLGLSCSMQTFSCGVCHVPWPGIEPRLPALGARSLSYWTTREVSIHSLLIELSRQEYWNGLPSPSQGMFLTQGSDPGIEPTSPALQVDSLASEPPGKPKIYLSNINLWSSSTSFIPSVNICLKIVFLNVFDWASIPVSRFIPISNRTLLLISS